MGNKFILELPDGCNIGRVDDDVTLTPYIEPDIEQVRKEAYEKGYSEGCDAKFRRLTGSEYQKGLSDAWDAARWIADRPYAEGEKVFGVAGWHIIEKFTASEAIEKIRQYEQEQEEIHVGDEVEWMGDKYVVTYVMCEAKKADLISCKFGSACENVAFSALVKTGRHFPEIAEVLKKMSEE